MGIPFIDFKFIRSRINQIDVEEDELNIDSSDRIETELAESQKEIDSREYKQSGNIARQQFLSRTKANVKDNKDKTKQKKEKEIEANKQKVKDTQQKER